MDKADEENFRLTSSGIYFLTCLESHEMLSLYLLSSILVVDSRKGREGEKKTSSRTEFVSLNQISFLMVFSQRTKLR